MYHVQNTFVEEVQIYSNDTYTPEVYAWVNNAWVSLQSSGLDTIYNKYNGNNITTNKLKIINALGNFNEIRVLGSPITDRLPQVKFIYPNGDQTMDDTFFNQVKVSCFVDNPDTQITINGIKASHDDNYFWIPTNKLSLTKWDTSTLTAIAIDQAGRTGTDTVNLYYGTKPLFTLDLPDAVYYTNLNTIAISGAVVKNGEAITINGQAIVVLKSKFNQNITLQDGLNVIEVDCIITSGNKTFKEKQFRYVISNAAPLKLTITNPTVNTYTNQPSIIVTGAVEGLWNVNVTVNGVFAATDNVYFVSNPVFLTEGKNTLTIKAFDSKGNTVTQQVSVIKDTKLSVMSNVMPLENTNINQLNIIVTGTVADTFPINSILANNNVGILSSTQFTVNVPVTAGQNTLKINATDFNK